MNITFLIGNGFDVGLGIRSRFKDFFPIYIENSKNKKEDIRQLSERIGSDYDTWSDFEIQMGKYTVEFDTQNKQLFPAQFRDFETEFVSYLKKEEQELSFNNQDEISKMMISALSGFYSLHNLRVGSNNTISAVFSSLRTQAHVYNFISFNYTNTLEKCLNTIPNGVVQKRAIGSTVLSDKVGKIVHVHGTCDNAPIMGVNDVAQITNKELVKDERFIRYLVKPKLNALHRTNQEVEASKMISSSQIICIYGMALGATDKLWWAKIIKWLNANADRQLVIFDYDPYFSEASQFDWIDKEDAIMDKLASNISLSDQINIESLRSRIHIAVHKNVFEMNLRTKREEKLIRELYGMTEEQSLSDAILEAYEQQKSVGV